ncbi:MAG: hypothetical protein F6K15_33130 [Okeania sp. SIO2B3]|nr:hypothetical protein [Okeania sp. SIO2B3]
MGITEDVVGTIVPEFFCPTLAQNANFLSYSAVRRQQLIWQQLIWGNKLLII